MKWTGCRQPSSKSRDLAEWSIPPHQHQIRRVHGGQRYHHAACGIVASKTSSTTSGLLAITSTRAAAFAWRLPCSYSRIVAGENPNRRANAAWLQPKPARIARTSTLAGAEDHDDASQGDQEGRQCRAYVNDTAWAADSHCMAMFAALTKATPGALVPTDGFYESPPCCRKVALCDGQAFLRIRRRRRAWREPGGGRGRRPC